MTQLDEAAILARLAAFARRITGRCQDGFRKDPRTGACRPAKQVRHLELARSFAAQHARHTAAAKTKAAERDAAHHRHQQNLVAGTARNQDAARVARLNRQASGHERKAEYAYQRHFFHLKKASET